MANQVVGIWVGGIVIVEVRGGFEILNFLNDTIVRVVDHVHCWRLQRSLRVEDEFFVGSRVIGEACTA